MTDHFAEFNLPHRPVIDAEELKENFHRRSLTTHPDQEDGDEEAFSRLNEAFQVLRVPLSRLRHLLELEYPDLLREDSTVPEGVAELFEKVGELRRDIQNFRREEQKLSSPIARAEQASAKLELLDRVRDALEKLQKKEREIFIKVGKLDAEWDKTPEKRGQRLANLYRSLAYFTKWADQLRNDMVQLEFGQDA